MKLNIALAAVAAFALSSCAQMEMNKYGVRTGDHEMTIARCGVGNYLFRHDPLNTCTTGTTAAVEKVAPVAAAPAQTQTQVATATEKKAKLTTDATTHQTVIEIAETINFQLGSAKLTKDSEKLLDDVASVVKENQSKIASLAVEGHTDAIGAPEKNMKLSQARANSVKAYLAKKGINGSMIKAQGFGHTRPKFTDKAEMAKNRRVEFICETKK